MWLYTVFLIQTCIKDYKPNFKVHDIDSVNTLQSTKSLDTEDAQAVMLQIARVKSLSAPKTKTMDNVSNNMTKRSTAGTQQSGGETSVSLHTLHRLLSLDNDTLVAEITSPNGPQSSNTTVHPSGQLQVADPASIK